MKLRKLFAVFAVLALVGAACGDSGTTTTEAPPATDAPTTTVGATTAPTTQPPTTEAPTTTAEMMAAPASDFGFDESTGTISLGVLAAITGPIAGIGQSLLAGHQVYWDAVNADGGVAGTYPIELVIRDNAYNPETNVVVYNEIKDEVLSFSSLIGTPTTASVFEAAGQEDILLAAGSLASQWALTDNVILNLAANTYFAQFANAPYWAMEIADPPVMTSESVVGIIYQADDYGQDCKNGYDFAQANLGFNDAYDATYAPTDSEFSGQIGGAAAAGVDVLFVCALPSALATMLGTAAAVQYSPAVFGSSPSYNVVLPAALGGEGGEAAGLALFNSFPYYSLGTTFAWESDLPGFTAMRDNQATYAPDLPPESINAFFFFGYTQAATFHQILETAVANGDITRLGMLAAVDGTTDIDLGVGGSPAGFGPTPTERVPTNDDGIGVPISTSEQAFGLDLVGGELYVAPYMADWVLGG